jgi:hypothetical protein
VKCRVLPDPGSLQFVDVKSENAKCAAAGNGEKYSFLCLTINSNSSVKRVKKTHVV